MLLLKVSNHVFYPLFFISVNKSFLIFVEADWIFDICCGSRELSLAAQKSGRNAIAFDKDRGKLEEVALKAIAISEHHDAKFRPDTDGKILTV